MEGERLLEGLNEAQRQAVTTTTSPLCILAGAGSGKTRVLTRRIAYRAATGGLDPRHVLALTFTRKAAGELTQRLRGLGLRDAVAAGTFHGLAYAQLRARWADRGIDPPTLLERKVGFIGRLLPRLEGRRPAATDALDVVGEIEWAKARLVEPDRYVTEAGRAARTPPFDAALVAEVFDRYERERRRRRMVDFDDLLRLCRRDLLDDREFRAAQRWRFQHLFVDEFQDVNPLQQALLDAWLGDRTDLCVVGDPDQAIYAWNGAEPRFIVEFGHTRPGSEMVHLVRNHRSSPQILAVADVVRLGGESATGTAGKLPPLEATRPDGPAPSVRSFADEQAEARGVARAVRDHRRPGTPWHDQAVLVRTNAQAALVAEALHQARIPFRVRGGGALLDQPEVKAALRDMRAGADLTTALADLEATLGPTEGATDADLERQANLEALVRLAHDHLALDGRATVAGFVAWLTDTTRGDGPDRHGDAVEVTTFHAAKGLEWPIVHLAGLEQGLVPIGHARTPDALAEERRLLYVALTRAERELHLTWAEQRSFGGRSSRRQPSPFLDAIAALEDELSRGAEPREAVARVISGRPSAASADRPSGAARATRRARRASGARPKVSGPPTLSPVARPVFEALKKWRAEQAKAASVPAYVVFHDRTLEAVAEAAPTTVDDLLALPGLGPVKVSRYGEDLLRVVSGQPAGVSE